MTPTKDCEYPNERHLLRRSSAHIKWLKLEVLFIIFFFRKILSVSSVQEVKKSLSSLVSDELFPALRPLPHRWNTAYLSLLCHYAHAKYSNELPSLVSTLQLGIAILCTQERIILGSFVFYWQEENSIWTDYLQDTLLCETYSSIPTYLTSSCQTSTFLYPTYPRNLQFLPPIKQSHLITLRLQ